MGEAQLMATPTGWSRTGRAATLLLLLLPLCGGPAMASAQEQAEAVVYEPSEAVEVDRDIVYATYGERQLLLDLYRPATREA